MDGRHLRRAALLLSAALALAMVATFGQCIGPLRQEPATQRLSMPVVDRVGPKPPSAPALKPAAIERARGWVAERGDFVESLSFEIQVAHIEPTDRLNLAVVGFDRCADEAPARRHAQSEFFATRLAVATLKRTLQVRRAARYEVEIELVSPRATFAPTGFTSAFIAVKEHC